VCVCVCVCVWNGGSCHCFMFHPGVSDWHHYGDGFYSCGLHSCVTLYNMMFKRNLEFFLYFYLLWVQLVVALHLTI
jgi:hypothetical protein